MNHKTSVIITSHNYGRFLASAISSVVNQTVKPKEIIVINDASDDNTESVATSFGRKIMYFKVDYRNVSKTRNFGLGKASGEYVVFLDADDFFRRDFLEKTQLVMEKNRDILLVYTDRINIGSENLLRSINQTREWKSQDFNYNILKKYNYISLPSLIRKDWFAGFDEKIHGYEDWEAWLNFLKYGAAERIPEPLFFVRFHENNKTFKENKSIERLKIFMKHGILSSQYSETIKEFFKDRFKKNKHAKSLVFVNLPVNKNDMKIFLDCLNKGHNRLVYFMAEQNTGNKNEVSHIREMLCEYEWELISLSLPNLDQFLYSLERKQYYHVKDFDYIYIINNVNSMLEIMRNDKKYLKRKVLICARKSIYDCRSISEFDVLFFNRKGIRIFFV